MELSNSKIKKMSYICSKKPPPYFSAQAGGKNKKNKKNKKKSKKIHLEKNSLYFKKWNFFALILKKIKKQKPWKKLLIFQIYTDISTYICI